MLVIGSRGSALALAQTNWVRDRILALNPGLDISIKIIRTSADKDTTTSIRAGSSVGVFVRELEQALLYGEIDLAVHSMKDLPTEIRPGLEIAAIPEREDIRDAFVSIKAATISELLENAVVGTGSVRRQAQLLAIRPGLVMKDIRGNVDTRLKKLQEGTYDAIVLACAGLNRLGLQDKITASLSLEQMLPAPGQGALALEIRADDRRVKPSVSSLNHLPSAIAVIAERAFLHRMGGGCNVPVAAYAYIQDNQIEIHGCVASADGKAIVRQSVRRPPEYANQAAVELADAIQAQGGRAILDQM
jgi:hydroxymethylbilane synthase